MLEDSHGKKGRAGYKNLGLYFSLKSEGLNEVRKFF